MRRGRCGSRRSPLLGIETIQFQGNQEAVAESDIPEEPALGQNRHAEEVIPGVAHDIPSEEGDGVSQGGQQPPEKQIQFVTDPSPVIPEELPFQIRRIQGKGAPLRDVQGLEGDSLQVPPLELRQGFPGGGGKRFHPQPPLVEFRKITHGRAGAD